MINQASLFKKKRFLLTFFIIFCCAQLAVPLYLLFKAYQIKNNSQTIRLACQPYDPYHFLQGRYVQLSFKQESKYISFLPSLKNQSFDRLKELPGKTVYGLFSHNRLTDIYLKKPKIGVIYVPIQVQSINKSKIRLRFPFNRYYLQENYAREAEKILRQAAREEEEKESGQSAGRSDKQELNPTLEIEIDQKGNFLVKSLLVQEIAIEDFIRQNLSNGE